MINILHLHRQKTATFHSALTHPYYRYFLQYAESLGVKDASFHIYSLVKQVDQSLPYQRQSILYQATCKGQPIGQNSTNQIA